MANSRYRPDSVMHMTRRTATQIPAQSVDQFAVATGFFERSKQFYGRLRIIRTTDRRLIYPYTGAEDLGPHRSAQEAIAAVQKLTEKIVAADLANPE